MLMKRCLLLVVALAFSSHVSASVLTFDYLSMKVPGAYGSHAAGPSSNLEEGLGWTPNVEVTFRLVDPATGAQVLCRPVCGQFDAAAWWVESHATMVNGAGPGVNDTYGEILFTPDPGWAVHLDQFQVLWYLGDPGQTIRVLDAASNVLWSAWPFSPDAAPEQRTVVPNIVSTGPLRLQIGTPGLWIDNVLFDQVTPPVEPVPEPASLLLLGSGLIGALRAAHQRRRV